MLPRVRGPCVDIGRVSCEWRGSPGEYRRRLAHVLWEPLSVTAPSSFRGPPSRACPREPPWPVGSRPRAGERHRLRGLALQPGHRRSRLDRQRRPRACAGSPGCVVHRADPGAGGRARGGHRALPATREAGRHGPHHRRRGRARGAPGPAQRRGDGRRLRGRAGHGHAGRRGHALRDDRRPPRLVALVAAGLAHRVRPGAHRGGRLGRASRPPSLPSCRPSSSRLEVVLGGYRRARLHHARPAGRGQPRR